MSNGNDFTQDATPAASPLDFVQLANFILLGCLYEAFAKEGFDKPDAVCHPRFIGRFRYWQNITLDGHLPAKWVDDVVVTLTRANTTAR